MGIILKPLINAVKKRRTDRSRPLKWTGRCRRIVEGKMRHEWSPEQIAGWLGRNETFSISHERIYQHIRRDRDRGGRLHTHLRQQQHNKRISFKTPHKGSIPHRISIDYRPAIVDKKTRIVDGEVDLMMGGHGGGGLLTLVDRKTRFTRMEPVLSKQADHVADVIIGALSEIKSQIHTLTMDNGNEFAQHKRFSKTLLAKGYFAHPYCAWERGANENTSADSARDANWLSLTCFAFPMFQGLYITLVPLRMVSMGLSETSIGLV